MRHLQAFILSLALAFTPVTQAGNSKIAQDLDKLFFNAELNREMTPADSLSRVVSVFTWNVQSGAVPNDPLNDIKRDAMNDKGEVVKYLLTQGYNYHVLIRLRYALGLDPHNVSYGVFDLSQLEGTVLGQAPAGIPEFVRVQNEHWATSSQGQLIVRFEPRLYWLLESVKHQVDQGVKAASQTSHTLRNLFVNRHTQILRLVDFGMAFESAAIQLQALDASFQIKIAEAGRDEGQIKRIQVVQSTWREEKEKFLNWADQISKVTAPMAAGRSAWEPLAKALTSGTTIKSWTKQLDKANLDAIEALDQALGNHDSSNRYAGDTAAEIEIKRREHLQKQKTYLESWSKNETFSYYRRTHEWPYKHYHSEEHGTFILQSESRRTRDIYDIDLAPLAEAQFAGQLADEGDRLLSRKLQREQILELRERLVKLKEQHRAYAAKGAQKPEVFPKNLQDGFVERFQARQQLLGEWIDFAIDDSYRQEAHEAQGYVGLNLDQEVASQYQAVLARLATVAKRFGIALAVGGTTAAAGVGTCAYLLLR